jgi:hypothetical protein
MNILSTIIELAGATCEDQEVVLHREKSWMLYFQL